MKEPLKLLSTWLAVNLRVRTTAGRKADHDQYEMICFRPANEPLRSEEEHALHTRRRSGVMSGPHNEISYRIVQSIQRTGPPDLSARREPEIK